MATLHVRNVPDRLYRRIQALARNESRSLTGEVIHLLDSAVREQEVRYGTGETIERIRMRREKTRLSADWVDSVKLIREDRKR